jgi:hypothetical protein
MLQHTKFNIFHTIDLFQLIPKIQKHPLYMDKNMNEELQKKSNFCFRNFSTDNPLQKTITKCTNSHGISLKVEYHRKSS